MRTLIRNVRIVDEATDTAGSVLIEQGLIAELFPGAAGAGAAEAELARCDRVIDGGYGKEPRSGPGLTLMPAFIDLHAHFRDPGFPEKETLESACLASVAGGYGTVVCMANTNPVMDDPERVRDLKERTARLGLIELFPALSLTRGMDGRDTSHLSRLARGDGAIRVLSEDGKDVAEEGVFLEAMRRAAALGLPVSCHCDAGGAAAAESKARGEPRAVWSRIEENVATERALSLAEAAGCHIHIAHVSTKEAVDAIRTAKRKRAKDGASPRITAEATPHHIALSEEDAERLGGESHGRVNPPLRTEADRRAVIEGLLDGTIDAIATDHAPHTEADKDRGAPGFSGLETAFATCMGELVAAERIDLKYLSRLMSSGPGKILGLGDRGLVRKGFRADLVLVDTDAAWTVDAADLRSRGKNTPLAGRTLRGRIFMTMHRGRTVYDRSDF